MPLDGILWDDLIQEHPVGTAHAVKSLIGARVDADWIENTCAIRVSRALNYSGHPVEASYKRNWAVTGSDGKWYAFRMLDIREYLVDTFGKPDVSATPRPGAVSSSIILFLHRKGIIAYTFSDEGRRRRSSTGHVDLWDGTSCNANGDECSGYFSDSRRVELWVAEDRPPSARPAPSNPR